MKGLFIFIGIAILLVGAFFVIGGGITGNAVGTASAQITMYKSPTCGCCVGHGGYLERVGFDVNTIADDRTLAKVKDEFGIPANMRSCHTAVIGDYFVEGHIPIEVIEKLLAEKPDIDGIALPGMPSGSPGMPGVKRGDWVIYAIKDGQVIREFVRV